MLTLSKLFGWNLNDATSIYNAIAECKPEEIRRILSTNATCIDATDPTGKQGLTPLQYAVLAVLTQHKTEGIHILLEYGADVDKRATCGLTALILACIQPGFSLETRAELIQILTDAGARFNKDNHLDQKALDIFKTNYPSVYNQFADIITTPVENIVVSSHSQNTTLRHRNNDKK